VSHIEKQRLIGSHNFFRHTTAVGNLGIRLIGKQSRFKFPLRRIVPLENPVRRMDRRKL